MPARELGSSFESSNGARKVGTTLLKKHRILPHPREHISEQIYTPTPAGKPRDLVIDTGYSSRPSSDTSSPKTLKHASKRIGGLPPTPPTHSRQSSGNQASITLAPRFDLTSIKAPSFAASSPGTPPNKHSPPTPDVTPPKHRAPVPFRPTVSERYASASSRAESFRTAQENIESEDDDEVTVRPTLHSARESENSVIRIPSIVQKRKEVGLGLGLESDGTTTPRQGRRSQQEFTVFDGEWVSGGETSEVEREWDDNLMRNVTVRKRPGRNLHSHMNGTTDDVIEDNIITPTLATRALRSQPLSERIARHRLERDTADRRSTEKFAERIEWPPAVADPESPVAPETKRFSVMSGRSVNSTVVEALVVETPLLRRKTLRHIKKQFGLREVSSDQSTANSVISSEPQIPLHHSRGRLPARRYESLVSNTTVSTASTSRSRRQILKDGGIPVVIIPDRRSSTKSSRAPSLRSTSSRRTKRSTSMTSAPLSHSSKFNEPEYFDRRPARRRTMSESETSSQSVRTIDFPPTIPARRSSLSAPTSRVGSRAPSLAPDSRDTSRAGSLTAESLKAHNMIQAKKQTLPPASQSQPSESHKETHRHHQLKVDHNGDPFFGNRLSTQVTPFSQYSYETAGTMAELSEAQAVELYPHQNKSLLVVEHQPSPPSLRPLDTFRAPPTMALNGATADGPATPPQPRHPMDEVDSPLRNPRDPPEPPAIKFIPPTPAGLTPGQEEDRQLGYDPNERPLTSEKPKRSTSLMRRAFSNSRRNSEPSSHHPGFLKRTFSLSNNRRRDEVDESTQTSKPEANPSTMYPSVEDRPPEATKLHPFWKPAHFWDDLEDEDDEYDEQFGGRYPMIDNRPKPKRTLSEKMKRTFAILPIEDDGEEERYNPVTPARRTVRRSASGNMRVVKQRSRASLQRQATAERRVLSEGAAQDQNQNQNQPWGYNFKEGNGGHNYRGYTIPGLGVRVEYVGWNGLKRRISERKREKRSQALRGNINKLEGVRDGVDDVLRRRNTRG